MKMSVTAIDQSVSYRINENYLLRIFYGEVTMEKIIESWKYVFKIYYSNDKKLVVVSDYRKSDLNVEVEDNELMQFFLLKNIGKFNNTIMAQVLNNSDIVYPMIFNMNNPELLSKAFSTMEGAHEWIGNY